MGDPSPSIPPFTLGGPLTLMVPFTVKVIWGGQGRLCGFLTPGIPLQGKHANFRLVTLSLNTLEKRLHLCSYFLSGETPS